MKIAKLKISIILIITLLISVAFSGCINPDNGEKLNVTIFAFCSDVGGDRNYTLNGDKTYGPEDVVWMYFEVEDFGSQKISDQYITKIGESLKVFYPNGEMYYAKQNMLVNEEGVDSWLNPWETLPDYLWFKQGLPIPYGFPKGTYEVEASITDKISKKSKTINDEFYIDYDLYASDMTYGSVDPQTGLDMPNLDAVYNTGDIIKTELKLYNIETIPQDDGTFRMITSQPEYTVYNSSGEVVYSISEDNTYYADEFVEQVNEYYSYVNTITNTTGFASDDYTIVTRMVDGVSLQEVTIYGSFTIN